MCLRDLANLGIFPFTFFFYLIEALLNLITTFKSLLQRSKRSLIARIGKLFDCFLNPRNGRRLYRRSEFSNDEVVRGDSFIDKLLLDTTLHRGYVYDPYYLEDSMIKFRRKILVNVSASAKLHDRFITGLRTFHRTKHCTLHESDGRTYVKAGLGAGALYFHNAGSVKLMNFGLTIHTHNILPYFEVSVEFNFDSTTGRDGRLTKLAVHDKRGIKGVKFWMTGLGPLNRVLNSLICATMKYFKGFLKSCIENKIKKHVAEHLPGFQFPIEETDIFIHETSNTSDETLSEIGMPTNEEYKEIKQLTTSKLKIEESEEMISAETLTCITEEQKTEETPVSKYVKYPIEAEHPEMVPVGQDAPAAPESKQSKGTAPVACDDQDVLTTDKPEQPEAVASIAYEDQVVPIADEFENLQIIAVDKDALTTNEPKQRKEAAPFANEDQVAPTTDEKEQTDAAAPITCEVQAASISYKLKLLDISVDQRVPTVEKPKQHEGLCQLPSVVPTDQVTSTANEPQEPETVRIAEVALVAEDPYYIQRRKRRRGRKI